MNKMVQEAPQSYRGRMFRQDSAKPKEQRLLVLKTGIAGLQYYIENEDERNALEVITPGTELLLFREPENPHDEWAIAIHLTREDKLGFITRFKNETIARMMDAGKKFIGVVDSLEENEDSPNAVNHGDRRSKSAPTENMSLPLSIYLIEEA